MLITTLGVSPFLFVPLLAKSNLSAKENVPLSSESYFEDKNLPAANNITGEKLTFYDTFGTNNAFVVTDSSDETRLYMSGNDNELVNLGMEL